MLHWNGFTNFVNCWWRAIDRVLLANIVLITIIGIFLILSVSPYVAQRIGRSSYYFIYSHFIHLAISFVALIFFSLLNEKGVQVFSYYMCFIVILLMIIVLFKGTAIKGARRWISIMHFSLQPSEFLKIFYSVAIALLISRKKYILIICSYIIIITLLLLQPDFGSSVLITAVLFGQIFISGLSLYYFLIFGTLSVCFGSLGYAFLPHIRVRIDKFLHHSSTIENYQVYKSLQAFSNGGFLGVGPGEGTVKRHLPDAHTDFIFAVAGEEFGLWFCCLIIILFLFYTWRVLYILLRYNVSKFHLLAISGLILQFSFQVIINIGVTMNMLPTKGMTLPFISYGGSATLAAAINVGLLLASIKEVKKQSYLMDHNTY